MAASRKEILAEGVELYLGDCLEILPTLSRVDAVVTDPPYGIEDIVGAYGRGARTIQNDKSLQACGGMFELVAQQKCCWVAAFYSCRISPTFFQNASSLAYFGEIIWDKKAPGMGGGLRYQHENIAFFKVGEPTPLADCFSVLTYYRVGQIHPHEKPIQVMEHLCKIVPGNIVLDPFMGSGTTGVAAINLGRKFIGIEIEPKYFEISIKRISHALKQQSLFTDKPESTSSDGLF